MWRAVVGLALAAVGLLTAVVTTVAATIQATRE